MPSLRDDCKPAKTRLCEPCARGLARVIETFREIRRHREVFVFLLAFWCYNDGINTIIKMATIYGAEIGIGQNDLIGALLLVQFVGIPATFAFGALAARIGPKRGVYLALAVYTGISILGFFMQEAWHFWTLACGVALVQGGSQALSRSLYASMIPPGKSVGIFRLLQHQRQVRQYLRSARLRRRQPTRRRQPLEHPIPNHLLRGRHAVTKTRQCRSRPKGGTRRRRRVASGVADPDRCHNQTVALNIKHPDAKRLAEELSAHTGESLAEAVVKALRERLVRETGRALRPSLKEDLLAMGDRMAALPDLDARGADEILGYDRRGVPK